MDTHVCTKFEVNSSIPSKVIVTTNRPTDQQKFFAKKTKLKQIDLFISAPLRENHNFIQLEILNGDRKQLAVFKRREMLLQDYAWETFTFTSITIFGHDD